jgi:hypothetical protein
MQDYKVEVGNEQFYKPRLFTYPDLNNSTAVFEFEDLSDDLMVIVCARARPDESDSIDAIYVW